jgi:hypothetical protein
VKGRRGVGSRIAGLVLAVVQLGRPWCLREGGWLGWEWSLQPGEGCSVSRRLECRVNLSISMSELNTLCDVFVMYRVNYTNVMN